MTIKTTSGERRGLKGPDFLVVGAQRSGTSWLYHVLSRHPALWLPPIKELHYFDDPSRSRYRKHLKVRWREILKFRRRPSSWDLRYFLGKPDDDWYCRLFSGGRRRGLVTGEVTPAYATLDVSTLERIKALNSAVKLIFVMRDPVLRAWSAAVNHHRKFADDDLPDADAALKRSRQASFQARSNYLETIQRLESVFSSGQIYYGFFDDLAGRPEAFVASILEFLTVPAGEIRPLLPVSPRNSAAGGRRPPAEFERELAGRFLPWVEKLCERFEGPPHEWREHYKKLVETREGTTQKHR